MIERLKAKLKALYDREPARVNAAVVTGVTTLAALVGLVLGATEIAIIGGLVGFILPELMAELTRPKVLPDAKVEAIAAQAMRHGYEEGARDERRATRLLEEEDVW